MSDESRPHHLKGHAPLDKVMSACNECIKGNHKKCNWTSTRGMVRCLCDWNNHK